MRGELILITMKNWENWYEVYKAELQARKIEAFNKGFNGEKLEPLKEFTLHINSNWNDFINEAKLTEDKPEFNYDNNSLNFNLEILNLALSKTLKQLNLIYPYDDSIIQLLLFKKINENHTLIDLIKILREPPVVWFLECSSCDFENEDSWTICRNCRKSFEESLQD